MRRHYAFVVYSTGPGPYKPVNGLPHRQCSFCEYEWAQAATKLIAFIVLVMPRMLITRLRL